MSEANAITPQTTMRTVEQGNSTVSYNEGETEVRAQQFFPNSSFSLFPNSQSIRVNSSGWYNQFTVNPNSGDQYYFGNNPRNLSTPEGLKNFNDSMQFGTIPRMIEDRTITIGNGSIIQQFASQYPEDQGWVLSNAGRQGVIATNPRSGQYGFINADGSFVSLNRRAS